MLPEYHEQELVAGSTTITGVTSGKVVVTLHWDINRTATFRVFVPDTTEVTLAELALQKYDSDPAVVSKVADAALRAEDAADRAEDVSDAFGSLEGVEDLVQAAEGAATSATSSAAAASVSATSANDSQVSAASSATAAAQSAVNAADSERVAGEHKGATESAAAGAVLSADDAATSAVDAEASASAAASSASTAGDHVAAASGHAQAAFEEAERSSSEADRAEAAAQSATTGVEPDTVGRLHLTPDLRGEIDGKAPSVHNHDGAYYTKAQADGQYVSTSGGTIRNGHLRMDGGEVHYIRPDTTGGWARGFFWMDRDATTIAGIGVLGNATIVNYFYLGHGNEPWSAPVFRAYQDRVSITNLEVTGAVTGIEADDVGAAPVVHTHTSEHISDATATGRSVLTASSQANARSAIGAGTSSLALGTTSSTAAAGNHTHSQYATTTTVNSVSGRVTTLENSQPIIVSSLPSSPLPGRIYYVTGA